jgi:hypothetical protein
VVKPCNFFTRDVAHRLGIILPGGSASNADSIIQALEHQWRQITPHDAILFAGKGVFIIAGLKSTEFAPRKDGKTVTKGHVCVVIPGRLGSYPRVVSTNDDAGVNAYGKSRGEFPLSGHVFSHVDAQRVRYFVEPRGASGSW